MRADLAPKFAVELSRAFKALGADRDLLAIIGSYADTLNDEEILDLLQGYNLGQPPFDEIIAEVKR